MNATHGAPICPRCRTRVDARRGPTAMCLSCGAPLPNFSAGQSSGSGVLVAILGVGAVLAMLIVGVAIYFAAHLRTEAAESVSTSTVAIESPAETAAASASASSAPKISAPLTDQEKDQLEGNYQCAMDDTPMFACRVSGGVLEKLAGSQRFKGPISKVATGNLSFSGSFFCPFGDCTHPVACTFIRQSAGKYVGKFGPNSVPGGGPGGERVVLNKVR
jgi:hypothetical protein